MGGEKISVDFSLDAQIERFLDNVEKTGKCCGCGKKVDRQKGWAMSEIREIKQEHSYGWEVTIFCPDCNKSHADVFMRGEYSGFARIRGD
jgi:hypothetical protein